MARTILSGRALGPFKWLPMPLCFCQGEAWHDLCLFKGQVCVVAGGGDEGAVPALPRD